MRAPPLHATPARPAPTTVRVAAAIRATAATLALVFLTACQLVTGDDPTTAVVTVTATRAPFAVDVPAEGYLEALTASPIAVPRVPTGALKVKQLVDEGTIVAAGDVILVFDNTQLNIELSNHRASFRSADRRIDKTQLQSDIVAGSIEAKRAVAELERDNAALIDLGTAGVFSRLEALEQSVRKEEAIETVVFAKASLLLRGEYYDIEERILGVEKGQVSGKIERVETSLANLVLKAPIAGMIVYKKNWRGTTVGIGDTLWPGNVVMSCVDPTSTALKAYLLEKDATGVTPGTAASIRVDAQPEREFKGSVKTIAEMASSIEQESPVKYFEVVIELEAGDPTLLKPGMKGRARIVVSQFDDAVVVPRSAVRGGDTPYVVVDDDQGGTRRPITLGPGDAVRVSVTSGLQGGERLVVGGAATEPTPAPSAKVGE